MKKSLIEYYVATAGTLWLHPRLYIVGAGLNEGNYSRFFDITQNLETIASCLSRVTLEKLKESNLNDVFVATDALSFLHCSKMC